MTRKISTGYWFFILILQLAIITGKVIADEFYLWNIVALAGALFFIYNRLVKNKVILGSEMPLSALIGINAMMTFLAQVIRFNSYAIVIISLMVAIVSFFMFYAIWKTEGQKND